MTLDELLATLDAEDETAPTEALAAGQNEKVGATSSVTPERRHGTIRTRITVSMILLTLLTLITLGTLLHLAEHRNLHARINGYLDRSKTELRVLATEGIDPATGERFAGPQPLLRTYLSRTVISEDEGELAFIGDQVLYYASTDVLLRPENDPELMAHIKPLAVGDEIVTSSITTAQREYRYLVAPVIFPTEQGALLHVYDLTAAQNQLNSTMWMFALAALGTMGVASVLAWLVVGSLMQPVERLRAAAEGIGDQDLKTRVPVEGNDDLTRLSGSINRMLDRLEASVEGQRKLLDDVGHELRTPITIVRGHLELIDPDDPDDVAQTTGLALDVLDRMGGLVNDLLILAKANEIDFVQPEWASISDLTDQTFQKAKGLGDHQWRLGRIVDADAWLDEGRVAQAWLQLIANADKYSAPGTPITIGSTIERGEVRLWVTDQGIGIAEEDLDEIRTRFGRAKGGILHASGSGLGLSIVESIMAAHNGRLDIESELGVGSTFTLVLPLTPKKEETP